LEKTFTGRRVSGDMHLLRVPLVARSNAPLR
jgi:hypothetical protein